MVGEKHRKNTNFFSLARDAIVSQEVFFEVRNVTHLFSASA